METLEIQSVNSNPQVAKIIFAENDDVGSCLLLLQKALDAKKLPRPQVLHQESSGKGTSFLISAPLEMFESIEKSLDHLKISAKLNQELATVTLTGRGIVSSGFCFDAVQTLAQEKISFENVITTPLSLSFVVSKASATKAVQTLHQAFVK